VDVGSWFSDWSLAQARKFPERRYAVVEPKYADIDTPIRQENPLFIGADGTKYLEAQRVKLLARREELQDAGVHVHAGSLSEFIDYMLENGLKTRHFNIDMPHPGNPQRPMVEEYGLSKLFDQAHLIQVPAGKIFVSSESKPVMADVSALARLKGFRPRPLKSFKGVPSNNLRTRIMQRIANRVGPQGIYRLEIISPIRRKIKD
jgi:hypothetical protein